MKNEEDFALRRGQHGGGLAFGVFETVVSVPTLAISK
jgi:hypothetical protein